MDNIKKSFSTYEEKFEEIKNKRNPHMNKKYAILSEMKELWVVLELLQKVLARAKHLSTKVLTDFEQYFSAIDIDDNRDMLDDLALYMEDISYPLEDFRSELVERMSSNLSKAASLFSLYANEREVAV